MISAEIQVGSFFHGEKRTYAWGTRVHPSTMVALVTAGLVETVQARVFMVGSSPRIHYRLTAQALAALPWDERHPQVQGFREWLRRAEAEHKARPVGR